MAKKVIIQKIGGCGGSCGGAGYGLRVIGAAVYYVKIADEEDHTL